MLTRADNLEALWDIEANVLAAALSLVEGTSMPLKVIPMFSDDEREGARCEIAVMLTQDLGIIQANDYGERYHSDYALQINFGIFAPKKQPQLLATARAALRAALYCPKGLNTLNDHLAHYEVASLMPETSLPEVDEEFDEVAHQLPYNIEIRVMPGAWPATPAA